MYHFIQCKDENGEWGIIEIRYCGSTDLEYLSTFNLSSKLFFESLVTIYKVIVMEV